jgi:hypothetical protein
VVFGHVFELRPAQTFGFECEGMGLSTHHCLCLATKIIKFAMLGTLASSVALFCSGGPLRLTAEAMKGVYHVLSRQDNQRLLFVLRPLYQLSLILLGVESEHHASCALQGSIIGNEEQEIAYVKETKNIKAEFCIYLSQAILAFYMRKFEICREAIEHCYQLPKTEIILLPSLDVQWCFFDAMSAICLLWKKSRSTDPSDKEAAKTTKHYIGIAERCLSKLESYTSSSPDFVDQKIFMIQAELKVLDGSIDEALELYQKSMEHSEGYDVTSDRALAYEQAGLALRHCQREDDALDYLEDCMVYYREYGALAKVNHVKGNVIPGWDDC